MASDVCRTAAPALAGDRHAVACHHPALDLAEVPT
jgi:hypothetical protein